MWLAAKNLYEESARLLITVGGVAFSVVLIVLVWGLYNGFNNNVSVYLRTWDADLIISQKGSADLSHSVSLLPTNVESQIAGIEGVSVVTPFISRLVGFDLNGSMVNLRLAGYTAGERNGGPVGIVSGRDVQQSGEIVIDRVFAKNNGLKLGDVLTIQAHDLRIVGISTKGNFFVYQYGFVDKSEARDMFQQEDFNNFYLVKVADKENLEEISQKIESIPGVQAASMDNFIGINQRLIRESFLPIVFVLVLVASIIGIAVIALTIYTNTINKSREFGVLKALGASNLQLYRMVLSQALISGVLGYIVGAIAGLLSTQLIIEFVPSFVSQMGVSNLLVIFGLSIFMSALASYAPVRKLVSLDPAMVFKA